MAVIIEKVAKKHILIAQKCMTLTLSNTFVPLLSQHNHARESLHQNILSVLETESGKKGEKQSFMKFHDEVVI